MVSLGVLTEVVPRSLSGQTVPVLDSPQVGNVLFFAELLWFVSGVCTI